MFCVETLCSVPTVRLGAPPRADRGVVERTGVPASAAEVHEGPHDHRCDLIARTYPPRDKVSNLGSSCQRVRDALGYADETHLVGRQPGVNVMMRASLVTGLLVATGGSEKRLGIESRTTHATASTPVTVSANLSVWYRRDANGSVRRSSKLHAVSVPEAHGAASQLSVPSRRVSVQPAVP